MDINSTLAIICYVFVTLLVVYWLYSMLNKYTERIKTDEKENNIKNPLI